MADAVLSIRANGGGIRTVRSQDRDDVLIYGGDNARKRLFLRWA